MRRDGRGLECLFTMSAQLTPPEDLSTLTDRGVLTESPSSKDASGFAKSAQVLAISHSPPMEAVDWSAYSASDSPCSVLASSSMTSFIFSSHVCSPPASQVGGAWSHSSNCCSNCAACGDSSLAGSVVSLRGHASFVLRSLHLCRGWHKVEGNTLRSPRLCASTRKHPEGVAGVAPIHALEAAQPPYTPG